MKDLMQAMGFLTHRARDLRTKSLGFKGVITLQKQTNWIIAFQSN